MSDWVLPDVQSFIAVKWV